MISHPRDESLQVLPHAPLYCIILLATVYVAAIAFVNPLGDFPLNDDWSFAIAVRTFVNDHTWRPIGWTSMPLFSNALWAAPMCSVTACSHEELRMTTLLASVVLISATFAMVWLVRNEPTLSTAAALLVAFNPIAFALSFTFMTDILFSALMAASATCFILSLQRNSAVFYSLGTLAAIGATLSRQLGLCIPAAYLAVQLLQAFGWRLWPIQPRKTVLAKLIKGTIPIAACVAALLLYNGWLEAQGRVPALYSQKSDELAALMNGPILATIKVASSHAFMILLYMGVFVAPILALTAGPEPIARRHGLLRRLPLLGALATAVFAVVGMVIMHRNMPVGGNILIPQGVGPLTLRDTYILNRASVAPLPQAFWLVVSLIGVWGAFELTRRIMTFLVTTISDRETERFPAARAVTMFCIFAASAYSTPLIVGPLFDRYLVPILPLTLLIVIALSPGPRRSPVSALFGGLILVGTIGYSVAAAHDYLSWNRARWSAIGELEMAGLANPRTMDGGFEYNGKYAYDPAYLRSDNKSWWWVKQDNYQITFEPIEGLQVVSKRPYACLLSPVPCAIYVLRK